MSLAASSFPSYPPADLSRLPVVALFCAVALLLGLALAPISPPQHRAGAAASAQAPAPAGSLLREGTELVDQAGQFKMNNSRLIFTMADGGRPLIGLENLNMERISKEVAETEPRTWIVSGTVTECQGINYILIRRAVQKSRG